MRVVISGASGFLGQRLARWLTENGHQVTRLVRRAAGSPGEVSWDPAAGRLDPAALAPHDAVVNLSGANIGDHRWTDRYKRVLVSSRIDTTGTLARALAALPGGERPGTLVNIGGINVYGDTGDSTVDEQSPPGTGFLADLCQRWEGATAPAEEAGVRVVRVRSGTPLHRDGGYLKPQMLPFRLGIGGKLGSGRQWMPWVSMVDWLLAMAFVLERAELAGPVNVVSPEPVRNSDFTREFGAALHRPVIMPLPTPALRVALGEMVPETLASVRARPGVLLDAGFRFRQPGVREALEAALHDR
ncbi:TIGR01777 family oxidoreductase [Phytohabitans suffuscus]|uniref:Epimerase n=1 Tax=Phytohabitans suffuscus TaxID=624315 RepID=A0A6F8YD62_9ACTN|nr:TIGR01777 family oxidoreductase [Phytohabitans suffuscus]BCB84042.1 epimerase [Phytohabitans suffuscus]